MANLVNYYEPYQRIQAFTTLPDADALLRKVIDYLLDMPTKDHQPFESNDCPRARIARYLYHDTSNPLSQPLPTPKQKKDLIYDPENPVTPPDAERKYRVYPQITVSQAQTDAQTRLYAFMGAVTATNSYRADISVCFRVLCSTVYDANTKDSALSRSYAMTTAIVEALNGVNISGVGALYFNRQQHGDCGIRFITDDQANVGYQLIMGLTVMGNKEANEPLF